MLNLSQNKFQFNFVLKMHHGQENNTKIHNPKILIYHKFIISQRLKGELGNIILKLNICLYC